VIRKVKYGNDDHKDDLRNERGNRQPIKGGDQQVFSLWMDIVKTDLKDHNGSQQSNCEKPEGNRDAEPQTRNVDQLCDRLQPVECQKINDQDGQAEQKNRKV
jgi:hypothetical protein